MRMIYEQDSEHLNPGAQQLEFIWLELTSRCNLNCVHCYAESSPHPQTPDTLVTQDYFNLLDSAASLGCRKVQFIGGEPTIVKELPDFIVHARHRGFEFIEVYTNATRISEQLLSCFVQNEVAVATSFYSDKSEVHDAITQKPGSHRLTANTIQRLIDAGLSVRVGIIVMDENRDGVDRTIDYLHSLGVTDVGIDRVRSFGRGSSITDGDSSLSELCGACWQGSLCVSSNGTVSPCIMSKDWSVGSTIEKELGELAQSQKLREIRTRIYQEVWLPQSQHHSGQYGPPDMGNGVDYKSACNPDCRPNCEPACNPRCSPNCSPCYPSGKCNPELFCGPCGPDKKKYKPTALNVQQYV